MNCVMLKYFEKLHTVELVCCKAAAWKRELGLKINLTSPNFDREERGGGGFVFLMLREEVMFYRKRAVFICFYAFL